MRWRPGPVLVALATAAVFVVARVCYAAVFGGLSAGEPVLLDLPRLRGAGVFAHVAFLGPVTGSAIVRTLLGALPFAAVIVGCGLLASLLDVRRGLARLAGHGPVRNLGRALVVAWDTVPSLVGAVRDSALAARLLGRRPGPRALVPVLEHAIEHAVALGASMEVRGLGARSRSEAVACERPVVAHGVVLSRGDWAMRVPELSLPAGSLVLVTGGTGSGKSTLLNAMSGLFQHADGGAQRGRLLIGDVDRLAALPRDTAGFVTAVAQRAKLAFVAESVREEIGFALTVRGVAQLLVSARVADVAARVGVTHLLDRSTSALSAGEAQLVAIAAAVVADPVLLLVDEPLAELDAAGRERIVALLAALAHEAGACVVVAEHRTRWFDGVADQTVSLVVPPTASAAAPGVPAASAVPAGPSGHVRVERTIADGSDRRERVRAEEQSRPHAAITAIIGPNGAGKSTELLRRAQAEPKRVALVPEALELLFTTDSVAAECRLADRRAARGACSASPWARTARLHGEAEPFASTGDALTAAAEAPWAQTARSAVGTGPFAPTGAGRSGGGAAGRTLAILSRLLGRDASALAERHPRDCSGGERLCLALAIQLVRGTPELLVDEPFRGLDARATAEVLTALRRAAEGGVAVTIATHELELAAELAGTVVEMGAPGAGDGGSHPSTRLRLAQGASSTRLRLAQGTSSTRLGAAQGAGSTGAER